MRIALVGNGKMARAIATLAQERGHQITTVITGPENRDAGAITPARLGQSDIVFEFTRPDAAGENLKRLAQLGRRVVSGTTGWQEHWPTVVAMVREHGGALLHSPNFSPGVQLFLRAAGEMARKFGGQTGFEAMVLESHHGAKRDAPSGTAVALRTVLRENDPGRGFPVTSIRGGFDPGTHSVIYDAPFETIRLEHQARSRQVFAAGALTAGEWLQGRTGVFTFEQMLFGEEP